MISGIYPRRLSAGTVATVVALSEGKAGKMFTDAEAARQEAEALEFANGVNGLLVRLLRHDQPEGGAVLVLERLYPRDFRSLEVEQRKALLAVFADELQELHEAGFVHGHLRREEGYTSEAWDNILLTDSGLRLIDAGRAVLKANAGEGGFEQALDAEQDALDAFSEYFLAR